MLASYIGTNQTGASSLPPEIWCTILDYLSCNHQLQVCQVSSYLCALARRAIYREVKLRSYEDASVTTLALLARDFSVACNVEKLHIHTIEKAANKPPWFDATIFVGMTRLRYLNLVGNPFYAIGDQEEIDSIISKTLPTLKKLQYTNPPSIRRRQALKRAKFFGLDTYGAKLHIKGLEEIVWANSCAFSSPLSVLPLAAASCSTIVHIHLPELLTPYKTTPPLAEFFDLCFPHLHTLHLQGWETNVSLKDAFTAFLLAHPLITDLHLGFYRLGHIGSTVSSIGLGPYALPKLRHLKVDTLNLATFVRAGILSLKTLESLHLSFPTEENLEVIRGVLEPIGGFQELKTLKLEHDGVINYMWGTDWVEGLGRLCPKLQQFWGDSGVGKAAVEDQSIFAWYTYLKILVLPDAGLGTLPRRRRMNDVREFAARNPSVVDLQFYSLHATNDVTFRFVIKRDTKGKITSMTEEAGGGQVHVGAELSCMCGV